MEEDKTKQEKEQKPEKSQGKKFVNPVLAWVILAVELAAAIIIGLIICQP